MDIPFSALPLSYRLKEDVEMLEREDGVIVISPQRQVTISHLSPELRRVMMMTKTGCSVQWMNDAVVGAYGEGMLLPFYRYLSCLLRHQMISISANNSDIGAPLATLLPISSYFQQKWVTIQSDRPYKISRFAYIRRDEDGCNYLESPLSHARLKLEHATTASFIYRLGTAITPAELTNLLPEEEKAVTTGLLALLVMGNFASPTTSEGRLSEEDDETLRQWDFHDLLFHSRSRAGRHDNMLGGTYRFLGQIPPQPVIKQAQWPVTLALPQPDMEKIYLEDPGLMAVMEARTSVRDYGHSPLTLAQLGEFLYRVAHIEEVYHDEEAGDLTRRFYPGGGASYEIEFYLTIDKCEGLTSGFYWYHPLDHTLALIQQANKDTEKLILDAYQATGESSRPHIVITLAARFQRIAWKYQGIAYALILKDVGVLYSTMYLIATAMNLAPCALGTGDSDLFTKLSGTDYLKETSVGEFVLGSKEEQKE